MRDDRFGFSTGALERGHYLKALDWISRQHIGCVELSALRYDELEPLVNDVAHLHLSDFKYVSFHAPSAFAPQEEERVVALLARVAERVSGIVVHPDVIYTPSRWAQFGPRLLIENMDRRKAVGRTAAEVSAILAELPQARLCLDLAHARQLDTTLSLLSMFVSQFNDRIAEVHISELDSRCRHHPLSCQAVSDFRRFAPMLADVPVIIESILYSYSSAVRRQEMKMATDAMGL